jgi:large subunit ribosomal protein L15
MLETHFDAGEEVTKDALKAKKIVKGHEFFSLKILGNGTLKKKLTVHADAFSKGAVAAIEKVGGKVVLSKETESGGITA